MVFCQTWNKFVLKTNQKNCTPYSDEEDESRTLGTEHQCDSSFGCNTFSLLSYSPPISLSLSLLLRFLSSLLPFVHFFLFFSTCFFIFQNFWKLFFCRFSSSTQFSTFRFWLDSFPIVFLSSLPHMPTSYHSISNAQLITVKLWIALEEQTIYHGNCMPIVQLACVLIQE